jgi:hypothetical protein
VGYLEERIQILMTEPSARDYKAQTLELLSDLELALHQNNQTEYFPTCPFRYLLYAHKNTDMVFELFYLGRTHVRDIPPDVFLGLGKKEDNPGLRKRLCEAYQTLFLGVHQKRPKESKSG